MTSYGRGPLPLLGDDVVRCLLYEEPVASLVVLPLVAVALGRVRHQALVVEPLREVDIPFSSFVEAEALVGVVQEVVPAPLLSVLSMTFWVVVDVV